MKAAMIPLGAGTIGLGLGLAIAVWRGDLAAQEGQPPPSLSARSAARESTPAGFSWVADARSLRPAPAPSAAHLRHLAEQPSPRVAGSDGPAVPTTGAGDDGLPDEAGSAIGEPVDAETYLQARDRAAAHSARSH
jgi:hypothetical protein